MCIGLPTWRASGLSGTIPEKSGPNSSSHVADDAICMKGMHVTIDVYCLVYCVKPS